MPAREPRPDTSNNALWERQEWETAKQYLDFCAYRDQGVKRTSEKTAAQVGKSVGYIGAICRQKKWVSRAGAWDAEQERILRESRQKGLMRAGEKQAYELEITRERTLLETARLAFAQLTNAASWDAKGLTLKDSSTLDESTKSAISEISMSYDKEGNPQPKIKFHPKPQMLQKLGEHFKLWDTPDQGQQNNLMVVLVQALRKGALSEPIEQAQDDIGKISWED